MKNIYKNYLIVGLTVLVVLLLVIIILLVLNKPNFSFFNNSDKNESQELNNKVDDEKEDSDISNNESNDIQPDNQDNSIIDSNNHSNTNVNNNNSSSNSNSNSKPNNETTNNSTAVSEADVISYFQNEENQYSTYTDQNDSSLRAKAKNGFITIIDFIFYGKEIKGYTFEGLTNSAKLQIIKIALTIDHKIEEYFPNYKTIIKDKYNDIKGKLAVKYLALTSSLCDAVGADTCNQFKEDFNSMKDSFGFTWSLLKELAKSGKDSIKDYYENEFRTN